MQSVYNKYFKNSLYCQPETTKRVVSCFSRLLNLVDEQLSMLNIISSMAPHEIIVILRTTADEFNVLLRTYNILVCMLPATWAPKDLMQAHRYFGEYIR